MCVSIALIPSSHTEFAPPANSPRKALKLFSSSHCVAPASPSAPIVLEAQSGDPPLESLSKYWCISNAKLSPGSTKFLKAMALHNSSPEVSYQFSSHECAPVQPLPGTSTRLEAPVSRIALMAACAVSAHRRVDMVFGSFMMAKTTFASPLKALAGLVQKSRKSSTATPEPVAPITSPPSTWPVVE